MTNSAGENSSKLGLVKILLGINLKDEFDTYEEFDNKLKDSSRKHFVHFWKRDCRTVEGAKKKTERYIDPKIKYYQLKYSCVHGGRMFKKRRDMQLRTECEANFYLTATPDGTKLFVKSLNNYHNHEVSEATYLKYFTEEKVKRGRPPRKVKQIKQEMEEYTSAYIYGKYDSDAETDNNMELSEGRDYPITVSLQPYEPLSNQSTVVQYDSSTCNPDTNALGQIKDDNIEEFLKYLGSEMRQIKSKRNLKNLKRKFISLVQNAQDDEDSV